jgi:hypothetical protein
MDPVDNPRKQAKSSGFLENRLKKPTSTTAITANCDPHHIARVREARIMSTSARTCCTEKRLRFCTYNRALRAPATGVLWNPFSWEKDPRLNPRACEVPCETVRPSSLSAAL